MNSFWTSSYNQPEICATEERTFPISKLILDYLLIGVLAVIIFYLSLLTTSIPTLPHERQKVNSAIDLLEEKGFDREVFILRQMVSFRSTDNWLNGLTENENAYAATNFPLYIVTLYPDFFDKTTDTAERAMVLLHEAQHLQGKNEPEAYEFVWRNRKRLGWTQLSHGTTPTYVTIAQQTRETVPDLFSCRENVWNDCTSDLKVAPRIAKRIKQTQ